MIGIYKIIKVITIIIIRSDSCCLWYLVGVFAAVVWFFRMYYDKHVSWRHHKARKILYSNMSVYYTAANSSTIRRKKDRMCKWARRYAGAIAIRVVRIEFHKIYKCLFVVLYQIEWFVYSNSQMKQQKEKKNGNICGKLGILICVAIWTNVFMVFKIDWFVWKFVKHRTRWNINQYYLPWKWN